MSRLISGHLCVVSHPVGESHFDGSAASLLGGGCAPQSRGDGGDSPKGRSEGKEVFPWQLSARSSGAAVPTLPRIDNPGYLQSEDSCPYSQPSHFTLPPVPRLWIGPFHVGVVTDLNVLFLCILDHHRPSCWRTSSYLKAARPLRAGELFSLSLRNIPAEEL